ncbi:meiotic recombination protein [Kluyveromyces marxianus DMKU3-1042]|uniref:Meiotic recombination protein n=1 Tax=Kluyveromyces marxianus (strain DMKU3-1042 / BCC 29191 / NBRC 104275) TaxID=1003335 RepID=W0TB89_KLUMD|nr:meiotic recombination protein [Kluyveromyces marxianus DMKU3-1042]BAO40086.1 meiotic recombination protein [Kluyveromyces marxianus DMKU3-1042]
MTDFSIPVRKYSFYTMLELAPQGFDMVKAPTLMDKWKHVSSEGRIHLMFSNTIDNRLVMKVVSQPYLQELEVIDFCTLRDSFVGFSQEPFQFSAKAPSISCKYLVRNDDMIVVRRFQLGFHNGVDFVQARDILHKLGFVVKPAVTTRTNTVVSQSQSFFFPQNQTTQALNNNFSFYNPAPSNNANPWQNSQQNMFQSNNNMDFFLSQSTPVQAAKGTSFQERMQTMVTQQTPEPSIEREKEKEQELEHPFNNIREVEQLFQKPNLQSLQKQEQIQLPDTTASKLMASKKVGSDTIPEASKGDCDETPKNTMELVTMEKIRSKIKDPDFMAWVRSVKYTRIPFQSD